MKNSTKLTALATLLSIYSAETFASYSPDYSDYSDSEEKHRSHRRQKNVLNAPTMNPMLKDVCASVHGMCKNIYQVSHSVASNRNYKRAEYANLRELRRSCRHNESNGCIFDLHQLVDGIIRYKADMVDYHYWLEAQLSLAKRQRQCDMLEDKASTAKQKCTLMREQVEHATSVKEKLNGTKQENSNMVKRLEQLRSTQNMRQLDIERHPTLLRKYTQELHNCDTALTQLARTNKARLQQERQKLDAAQQELATARETHRSLRDQLIENEMINLQQALENAEGLLHQSKKNIIAQRQALSDMQNELSQTNTNIRSHHNTTNDDVYSDSESAYSDG